MEKRKVSVCDVFINVLYMMTQSFDLIFRDLEWRMEKKAREEEGRAVEFKREKKKMFNEYIDTIRKALALIRKSEALNETITQDIYDSSAKNNYKSIPIWQLESNELARLILLYADHSSSEDSVNKIHKFIRSLPGEGIITEDVLKNFYLKKI